MPGRVAQAADGQRVVDRAAGRVDLERERTGEVDARDVDSDIGADRAEQRDPVAAFPIDEGVLGIDFRCKTGAHRSIAGQRRADIRGGRNMIP